MAVIVARILAKVESTERQPPAPQRPKRDQAGTPPLPTTQVTQADLDLIVRSSTN